MKSKGWMTVKELWRQANPRQLEAIQAVDGVIQIGAVAGSGKTYVLTLRVEYMVNDLKIDPSTIAMMTFTGEAAKNMRNRIIDKNLLSKADMDAMFCGTSHSFGYKILAKEFKELNHPLQTFTRNDKGNPGILSGGWQKSLAEDVKKDLLAMPWDADIIQQLEEIGVKQFLRFVSLAKNNNKDPMQVEQELAMNASANTWAYINFYKMYEQEKNRRKAIDFDDMLFMAVRLLQDKPEILRKYQKQYKYIMTDEAQDNNVLQYLLVKMIGAPENNLFFVGDDDQSMYAFRGADPDSFIKLCESYANLRQIPLENNYRSVPDVLNRANKLIANNTNRIVKQLVPHKEDDSKAVFYSHFDDEMAESEWIAKEIQAIIGNQDGDFTDQIEYKHIACLYRTNAQCKELEDALITHNIPYVIHGGYSFYERREVKDILAYLSLAVNPTDNLAFKRIYNVPKRFLGKAFLDKISMPRGSAMYQNMQKCSKLTSREQDSADSIVRMVNDIKRRLDDQVPLDEVIDFIMDNGYKQYLNDLNDVEEDDEEEGENEIVAKLKFFAKRFERIQDLFAYVELMTGKKKTNVNGVQLMTIHRSKGLEFNTVFGTGFNENLLPHYRSIEAVDSGEKPLAIEEERRLAYVLVTRGESKVFLSSTSSFNGKAQAPSRFIWEMELREDETPEFEGVASVNAEPIETPEPKSPKKVDAHPEEEVVHKAIVQEDSQPETNDSIIGKLDDIPEIDDVNIEEASKPQPEESVVEKVIKKSGTRHRSGLATEPIKDESIASRYWC